MSLGRELFPTIHLLSAWLRLSSPPCDLCEGHGTGTAAKAQHGSGSIPSLPVPDVPLCPCRTLTHAVPSIPASSALRAVDPLDVKVIECPSPGAVPAGLAVLKNGAA